MIPGNRSVLTVDNEGGNGDLSSNVHELGDESEDGVLALPERAVIDEASRGLHVLHRLLRDLGHGGEEEEDDDGGSKAGDGEVDVLQGRLQVSELDLAERLAGPSAKDALVASSRADTKLTCTDPRPVCPSPKKYLEAMRGPTNEASPLNDCEKLRRKAACSGLPRTVTYELAHTSSVASPQAMTKAEPTNPPNVSNLAEGQKHSAPTQ